MANGDDSAAIRKRWHELAGSGLPLEAESVFRETDGYLVRRANEARVKLLQSLAPLLAKALEPAETIRYAACGTRYSAAELFLSGHLAARSANRTALVLTDRRLLLLQVDAGGDRRTSRTSSGSSASAALPPAGSVRSPSRPSRARSWSSTPCRGPTGTP